MRASLQLEVSSQGVWAGGIAVSWDQRTDFEPSLVPNRFKSW